MDVLTPVTCPRCNQTILAGKVEGVGWRVDPYRVSIEDATVLVRYGVGVLVVDWSAGRQWHGSGWQPQTHDLDKPGRYLLAPHSCGSAHSQQES